MMESNLVNRILADLDAMQKRGACSFRDCTAGEEMHAAADELSYAMRLIERAAARFGIRPEYQAIMQAGRDAATAGVPWYKNPYPSGSWQAYQWDQGQVEYHKAVMS